MAKVQVGTILANNDPRQLGAQVQVAGVEEPTMKNAYQFMRSTTPPARTKSVSTASSMTAASGARVGR